MAQNRFAEIFKNHYMLREKNKGASLALLGKVAVKFFYISDPESQWTPVEVKGFQLIAKEALRTLRRQAAEAGISLEFSIGEDMVTLPYVCNEDNYHRWSKDCIRQFGAQTTAQYQQKQENKWGVREAPYVFVLRKVFRAYAVAAACNAADADEYSVVGVSDDQQTIRHELLHQFGAMDLYFPRDVDAAAKKYLPGSIMNEGDRIDDLTRYLIGWTDTLSDNAALFLLSTAHYSYDDYQNQLEKELNTRE